MNIPKPTQTNAPTSMEMCRRVWLWDFKLLREDPTFVTKKYTFLILRKSFQMRMCSTVNNA